MTSSATPKDISSVFSNHADVMHWFPKHGENMDTFRKAVKKRWRTVQISILILGGDMVEFKVKDYRDVKKTKDGVQGRVKYSSKKGSRNDNFIKCKSFCRQKLVRITRKNTTKINIWNGLSPPGYN